jgi:hypothetical protein
VVTRRAKQRGQRGVGFILLLEISRGLVINTGNPLESKTGTLVGGQNKWLCAGKGSRSSGFAQSASSFSTWLTRVLAG